MRLIGSFHTMTIHGMSGSTCVSETGRSTSAGAVEARTGAMRQILSRCGRVRWSPGRGGRTIGCDMAVGNPPGGIPGARALVPSRLVGRVGFGHAGPVRVARTKVGA